MGASLLHPMAFARFAYTGALIWSTSFIGLGYLAGEEWNQLFPILHRTVIAVTPPGDSGRRMTSRDSVHRRDDGMIVACTRD